MELLHIADQLVQTIDALSFGPPVAYVYNPLVYARSGYARYVQRFGQAPKQVLLVGMNPGPWGMAQTGVPFGEIQAVRDWMGLRFEVAKPAQEHPARPVEGLACLRSEVSGARLWRWAANTFGPPERFFERFFVLNYCPLMFMEDSGRNRTPDKLPTAQRQPLLDVCDAALQQAIAHLQPEYAVGIGRFAEQRLHRVLGDSPITIGSIVHPSPANPIANRGWSQLIEAQLNGLGVRW